MKPIVCLWCLLVFATSAQAGNKLYLGMEIEEAKSILSEYKILHKLTSGEYSEDFSFIYYKLEERTELEIVTEQGHIRSLSITFLLKRRMKGMDIVKRIEFIEFSKNGDYTIKIKKEPNQQVEPIATTPVDKVEAQSTQAHP